MEALLEIPGRRASSDRFKPAGFFFQLEFDLQFRVERILNHPFFAELSTGSMKPAQLRAFALQYNIYREYFPRCVAAVAANVPDDDTRLTLVDNLWEEHGSGNIEFSHGNLYRRFLKALGLGCDEITGTMPFEVTRRYNADLFQLYHDGHFLEGMGALGPGTESFTSEEYSVIMAGLREYDYISEEAVEFFRVHTDVDEVHSSGILTALTSWANSAENRSLIRQGAQRAVELEIQFWNGLYDAIMLIH